MPETRTNYGLVSSDGICTTIVDYEKPFDGVKSFAVEKSAENMWGGGATHGWTAVGATITELEDGWKKINVPSNGNRYVYLSIPISPNVHTFSCEFRRINSATASVQCGDYNAGLPSNGRAIMHLRNSTAPGRYALSYNDTTTGRETLLVYIHMGSSAQAGDFVEYRFPMLESGTIATQYVEPGLTRPTGKFTVSKEDLLKKGITHNNYAVNFWAYFKATAAEHYTGNSSDAAFIFVSTSNGIGDNGIRLFVGSNNLLAFESKGTSATVVSDIAYPSTGWKNISIVQTASAAKLYINGVLSGNITTNLAAALNDFRFGWCNETVLRPYNGLLSNILITKADVMTDAYIKAIYNAKKPFQRQASGLIL
jgi:hypothetical protein